MLLFVGEHHLATGIPSAGPLALKQNSGNNGKQNNGKQDNGGRRSFLNGVNGALDGEKNGGIRGTMLKCERKDTLQYP